MSSFNLGSEEKIPNPIKKNKTIGIILVSICSVVFVLLLTNFFPFLKSVVLGLFGLFSYPLSLVLFAVGIALINNKKYVMPTKYIVFLGICIVSILAILNIIILGKPDVSFFEYLGLAYGKMYTAGGLLVSALVAPFLFGLGIAGAVVVFGILLVIFIALIVDFLNSIKIYGLKNIPNKKQKEIKIISVEEKQKKAVRIEEKIPEKITPKIKNKSEKEDFELFLDKKLAEQSNTEAKIKLGLIEGNLDSQKSSDSKPKSIREQLLTPPPINLDYFKNNNSVQKRENEIKTNINILKNENPNNHFVQKNQLYEQQDNFEEEEEDDIVISSQNSQNNFAINSNPDIIKENNFTKPIKNEDNIIFDNSKKNFAQLEIEGAEKSRFKQTENVYRRPPNYIRPPLELLDNTPVDLTSLNEDVVGKRVQLENALETFGINAKVIGVVVGPAVTRYELEMPPGVSVKKIIAHEDDISLALASKAGIRIEAPIPGKSAVGVEVPNDNIATVSIRDIIESQEFLAERSPVTFALGKDISGSVQLCNLFKSQHLLIAGATGSGKSICLNAIIVSLIYKASPDDVKLILIDPKSVEFTPYAEIPHLLMPNIITKADKANNILGWAIKEMDRRFQDVLNPSRCRNLDEYNNQPQVLRGELPKLPFIVIIVDEYNDLLMMSHNRKEIEDKIQRLGQKARAAGIYMILATQRPSVDVITGSIKANFVSRIAFALKSFVDSKTILDEGGAESLLGKGDMLYFPTGDNFPKRVQGCYVSKEEIDQIVRYVKENNESKFNEDLETEINKTSTAGVYDGIVGDPNFDPLLPQALKMFIENGQASSSALQRRFLIGFPRASRIVDQLETMNYVSKQEGSKPRTVYLTMQEFYDKFGNVE